MSTTLTARRGVIDRYRSWLPVTEATPVITLGEGSTPLVPAQVLSEELGCEVWLKVEGANPTGSFKDRGMTVAVSVSAGEGAEAVVCASTGNTSASAAAYASRGGLKPIVLLPAGRIAAGKLAQAIVHGAQVVQVEGNFDDCLRLARSLAESYPVALVNSVNPVRIEGQKTAAFEIVDDLGDAPDLHVLPVGNGGNISAYWRGYVQYAEAGIAGHRPRMWAFQAAGAARWCSATRCRTRRRWRPRSGSATRRPPPWRWPRRRSRVVASVRSPMRRSLPHKGFWPPGRVSSSSRRRPPESPACEVWPGGVRSIPGSASWSR